MNPQYGDLNWTPSETDYQPGQTSSGQPYKMQYTPSGYGFIFTPTGNGLARVLYFDPSGNPITTQQWQQGADPSGTTFNTQQIDQAAQTGYDSYDRWRGDNGLSNATGVRDNPFSSAQTPQTPVENTALGSNNPNLVGNFNRATNKAGTQPWPPTYANTVAPATGGSGAAATSTPTPAPASSTPPAAPTWQPRYYEGTGQYYTDQAAYTTAVQKDIVDTYNKSVKNAKDLYDNGIITLDQLQQNISQTRQNLSQQLTTALQGTSGYFNSVSPEASQSQEGTYMNKINTQNQTAQTNLGTPLPGKIESLSPDQLSGYTNELSDTGNAARYFQSLGSQQSQNLDTATANKNKALADFGNANLAESTAGSSTALPGTPSSTTYNDWLNNYGTYMNSLPNTTALPAPALAGVGGSPAPNSNQPPIKQFTYP
jgi:hypothetical protein